ncbi:MAG: response regulator [Pyrinomonadaceae bacterium]|nr:response regulator [Pyrinomonadaceae bacterium]
MPSQNRSRVLCVDDDADACEMLTVLLHAYGIDATCAKSAAEAWLEIKKNSFDLYVLDGWLPHQDGFEFCRQIRRSDSKTPILFYSGAAYDADRQKGIAAGANGYVAKPDVEGLIETMVQLMAMSRENDLDALRAGSQRRPDVTSPSAQYFSLETVCT